MFNKIIDGINKKTIEFITKIATFLGVYALHQLTFDIGIPLPLLALIISVIVGLAWLATAEEPKKKAIPVTVIKDAEHVFPEMAGGK